MRYAVLFMALCALPLCGVAQTPTSFALTGQVLDGETGMALVGAHVFLANSTQGTVSDSDGHFTLHPLPAGTHEIAASMLGYTLASVHMTFPRDEQSPHTFRLTPRVLTMEGVVVAAERDEEALQNRSRFIDRFTDHFLGNTENASKCTLLNPEVLHFAEASEDRLLVQSTEPLLIENRALGYRLFYHLKELEATDSGVRYYGTIRFEELPPRNRRERRRWHRNRREAYEGSIQHFITTLAEANNGHAVRRAGYVVGLSTRFETDPMYAIGVHEEELLQPATEPHRYFLTYPDYLQIFYEPDMPLAPPVGIPGGGRNEGKEAYTSWIKLNGGAAEVDAFGHFSEPYAVTTYGLWGRSRVADALPRNYRPD